MPQLRKESQKQLPTTQPCMVAPCYATTPPVASPYYITMISPHTAPSSYSHLQHHNTPTIAPVKKSTSDKCLTVYENINPQHNDNDNNYTATVMHSIRPYCITSREL